MALKKELEVMDDQNTFFNLELHCTKTGTVDQKQIEFASSPKTVRDVKTKIEHKYNIPVCTQTLSFESQVLSDGTHLESVRIRSGDTFRISYYADGNCAEILKVIGWFKTVLVALRIENPSISEGISFELEELLTMGIEEEFVENLAFEYFFPWLDARKYVNKLHFIHSGGIEVIMSIYSLLFRHPWPNCRLKLKYMEYGILRVLWNLSETFALRRLITKHDGLQLCMKSLLRKKLEEGQPIEDRETPGHQVMNQDWILIENIGAALGTLCNLSELPECHMEIATNQDVLFQLTCISLTPSVRIMSPQLVATLFLCVAYTPSTHEHLAHPVIIRRLLKACKMKREFGEKEEEETDTLMLCYFTQLFLAQLILVSPSVVHSDFYDPICAHMENFFQNTTYQKIMEGEVKQWYVWSTFIPYVKLAYIPDTPQPEAVRKLQLLSLQTVIFSLQNMLGRENHRQVLKREGLVDYVTCMPFYVAETLKPRARELVQMLASSGDLQVQAPTLVNLVKAKLAKTYFGLERVLTMSVAELFSKVLPL